MLGDTKGSIQTEASALATKSHEHNHGANYSSDLRHPQKGNHWCDFGQKTNQIKEIYWKLHGKPRIQTTATIKDNLKFFEKILMPNSPIPNSENRNMVKTWTL